MKTRFNRARLCALAFALIAPLAAAGPGEDTEQAETEFARGNLVGAMKLWRQAADAGYAQAQARMGDMLDKAEADVLAIEWYRKSAAQGNADGEYGLGQMYAKGEGTERDIEQAYQYILRAAEKGHFNATVALREAYRLGSLGRTIDPVKSAEWDARVKQLAAAQLASERQIK